MKLATYLFVGYFAFAMTAANADNTTQILDLAYRQASDAYMKIEKHLESGRCRQKNLTVSQIKKMGLTAQQWRQAVMHLARRADDRCQHPWRLELEAVLNRYFWLEKKLTGKNERPIKIPPSTTVAQDYVTAILYQQVENDLNHQILFSKLPPEIQNKLLTAPEFQTPFDTSPILDLIRELAKSEPQSKK